MWTKAFDGFGWCIFDENGKMFCDVDTKEQADIIAAGPEMLEGLKYALRHHDGNCGDHCLNSCEWCVVRAAIAKAEGR